MLILNTYSFQKKILSNLTCVLLEDSFKGSCRNISTTKYTVKEVTIFIFVTF